MIDMVLRDLAMYKPRMQVLLLREIISRIIGDLYYYVLCATME
jgi:hypothetical protein